MINITTGEVRCGQVRSGQVLSGPFLPLRCASLAASGRASVLRVCWCYGPKSIKTGQGWKCTGSTTTPLLQYIFAVQDLQHAVLYFLIFGAAGKLPSEASKTKWIIIISMSLYVWYKLKSVKFTWKTIHEYCN